MKQARAMAISIRVKIGQRQNSNTALAPRESLLNVSSLNPLNEKLLPMLRMLPLIRRVALAFIKGVPAEQHGVQYHTTGPYVCRSAFIELVLPHIAQHLRCCKTLHMSTPSKPQMGHGAVERHMFVGLHPVCVLLYTVIRSYTGQDNSVACVLCLSRATEAQQCIGLDCMCDISYIII